MTDPDRCAALARDVSLWLDGRLEPAERASLEEHAASCPACAALLARAREADSLARAAFPPVEPDPGLVAAIERRALAEGPPRLQPRFAGLSFAGLSFAAGIVVGLGVAFSVQGSSRSVPAPPPPTEVPLQRFAVASDALLTDLVELAGEDPPRDLALLRRESEVLDVPGAVRALREALPAIDARDPILARQAERAAAGTEAITVALAATDAAVSSGASATLELFELRDEAERLELPAMVRGLARGGIPRPERRVETISFETFEPAGLEQTADRTYLAGLAQYAKGDLEGARFQWARVAHGPGEGAWAARAGYWSARVHILDGRPEQAIASLKPVLAFRPMALHNTPVGSALRASFEHATMVPGHELHGVFGHAQAVPATPATPGVPAHSVRGVRTTQDHQVIVLRKAVVGKAGQEFVVARAQLPDDLKDVVLHLVPSDSEPRIEQLFSVRADGRDVPLTENGRETFRALGPIMARRLVSQGRVGVAHGERGQVTVTLRLADVRFSSPEDRHFAKTLGDALGEPVISEDGTSRVGRVELEGTVAP